MAVPCARRRLASMLPHVAYSRLAQLLHTPALLFAAVLCARRRLAPMLPHVAYPRLAQLGSFLHFCLPQCSVCGAVWRPCFRMSHTHGWRSWAVSCTSVCRGALCAAPSGVLAQHATVSRLSSMLLRVTVSRLVQSGILLHSCVPLCFAVGAVWRLITGNPLVANLGAISGNCFQQPEDLPN